MSVDALDNPPSSTNSRGQFLIAFGLAILISGAWWPDASVLTALALVALGATRITIKRVEFQPMFGLVLAAHLWVYSVLYLILLGGIWHSSLAIFHARWSLIDSLDLAASSVTMAAVFRASIVATRQQRRGPNATRY